MPIVQAWEHCRRPDCFYPIDCKHDYVQDLKEEAFYNLMRKFQDRLYGMSDYFSFRHYSISHMVEIINQYKKDFLKSCAQDLAFRVCEPAWREYQFCKTLDLIIDEHNVVEIRNFNDDAGYVDVTVKVLSWGFLSGLNNARGTLKQVESNFFFKRNYDAKKPSDLDGTEIELDFENDTMVLVSTAPEICAWVSHVFEGLNVYREIADQFVTNEYHYDRDYEYGPVPVY